MTLTPWEVIGVKNPFWGQIEPKWKRDHSSVKYCPIAFKFTWIITWDQRKNTKMLPLEIQIKSTFSSNYILLSFKKKVCNSHSGQTSPFILGKFYSLFKNGHICLKLKSYYNYEALGTTYQKISKIAS